MTEKTMLTGMLVIFSFSVPNSQTSASKQRLTLLLCPQPLWRGYYIFSFPSFSREQGGQAGSRRRWDNQASMAFLRPGHRTGHFNSLSHPGSLSHRQLIFGEPAKFSGVWSEAGCNAKKLVASKNNNEDLQPKEGRRSATAQGRIWSLHRTELPMFWLLSLGDTSVRPRSY